MLGNWNRLREKRQGISLHYDASASDKSAVEWLTANPLCKVSYTKLILDDGKVVQIAPDNARQWSEGNCRPSSSLFTYKDANSAFYGVCIAATNGDKITQKQFDSLVNVCIEYFKAEKWTTNEVWRITSHELEAWPRKRKVDISGTQTLNGRPNKNYPVCDLGAVRLEVEKRLNAQQSI